METVAHGDRSRILSPRQVVARNDVEWRALWAAHAGPDAEPPAVDFESRMAAAVFAGEGAPAGSEISIGASRRNGAVLMLLVEEHRADGGSTPAAVASAPFHIVTLPRYEGEVAFVDADDPRARGIGTTVRQAWRHEPAPSSTGLAPHVAGALAYVAGPFSGALLLLAEGTSRFVKFHAWQALLALGTLGAAALLFLMLAFILLIVSAGAFWTMLWLASATAVAWLVLWVVCIVQALRGRIWRLPVAGAYAGRRAGLGG